MIARGCVAEARGAWIAARLPGARVGDGVTIETDPPIAGHVAAVRSGDVVVAAHAGVAGVGRTTALRLDPSTRRVPLGTCALGRAIDARGRPLDGGPPLRGPRVCLDAIGIVPEDRVAVTQPFWTGLRAIDGVLAFGRGARIGLFGAPGCGKSVLVERMARGATADAVVVAAIGERGREAHRWIARCDARTTVVGATGDRPPAERVAAAFLAVAHANALRMRGLHVLLLLDSFARVAAALRELAIGAGEGAGRGGYPPSVFADLARIAEAAGASTTGSVTMVATVLDDGDERDPVSDAARSQLDGHVALSPRLARAGRFPAIDVVASTSRTMASVLSDAQLDDARRVRAALALLDRADDVRRAGIQPSDAATQRAIAAEERLERFLRQGEQACDPSETRNALRDLARYLE